MSPDPSPFSGLTWPQPQLHALLTHAVTFGSAGLCAARAPVTSAMCGSRGQNTCADLALSPPALRSGADALSHFENALPSVSDTSQDRSARLRDCGSSGPAHSLSCPRSSSSCTHAELTGCADSRFRENQDGVKGDVCGLKP